ncbi:MAG: error-prone DNA polymerase [Gemmataceae bacterium]|nr:error-prone DNA polymerase [Gemmataceae bacterium]
MIRYAELHCRTNYSFLEGASHADELVATAAEHGYAALAVTDRESLAGVVRAYVATKDHPLHLIVGAEIRPTDASPVVVWATDRASYGRLCRLLTVGRRRAEKGSCILTFDDLAGHAEGLLAGVVPDDTFRVRGPYRDLFGERAYLLAELFRGPDDAGRLTRLQSLSRGTRLPLVAANDVRYHAPSRAPLHDVLTAIKHGTTVGIAGELLHPNAQRHLRPLPEILHVFADEPAAIARTTEIADRCTFRLDELRYEYPDELVPDNCSIGEYLARLTWEGATERYPEGVPDDVRKLIQHELTLIAELRYEPYFLTVYDLVRFARSRDILCQGRGSAANSVVCYCLGVTSVDPQRVNLLFERFVSKERDEAPDIDIDFEHERREEVLQYLYTKYGRERAGLAAAVITYCARSAIRDVGKALGYSADRIDAFAGEVEGYHHEELLPKRAASAGVDPDTPDGARWLSLVNELLGFPRHLSQHVGGMVMTRGPLCELVPIENAAMPDRSVVQWDKDDLEALGILKVDVLALGMLTAIRKCFALVEAHWGRPLTLATVPAEDSIVYDMICEADTVGVFQIESRGQMSMLPRLRPRDYYDLVIEVAIMRPGPIQGQMVHPFLRRRKGEEIPEYPNDDIRAVLHRTLGVPLFQEQAMRLAVVAAGFTPGEADQLRRAMGAWRKTGVIDKFRIKLLNGMRERGLSDHFAEQVFRQIRGFGEYGFPESHAASFALLVYVSSWLKRYYPAAFAAALINSQPMGFYAPAQLVQDARQHGVRVRPVDVNHSEYDCTLESGDRGPELRLGFRLIAGIRRDAVAAIESARADGPFTSLPEFGRRTGLPRAALESLSDADAFGSLKLDRRSALWHSLAQAKVPAGPSLFTGADDRCSAESLPELSPFDQVIADYRTTGLSLKGHPVGFYREHLDAWKVTPAERLKSIPHGTRIVVAGLVLLRQRPGTAKGITFVTLEDETGVANLILHPRTWESYYRVARHSPAWVARGVLESKDSVIHVVVRTIEDLATRLGEIRLKPREFR